MAPRRRRPVYGRALTARRLLRQGRVVQALQAQGWPKTDANRAAFRTKGRGGHDRVEPADSDRNDRNAEARGDHPDSGRNGRSPQTCFAGLPEDENE